MLIIGTFNIRIKLVLIAMASNTHTYLSYQADQISARTRLYQILSSEKAVVFRRGAAEEGYYYSLLPITQVSCHSWQYSLD